MYKINTKKSCLTNLFNLITFFFDQLKYSSMFFLFFLEMATEENYCNHYKNNKCDNL
jgi:hypothetical protein